MNVVQVMGPSGVMQTLDLDDQKAVDEFKARMATPPPPVPVKLDLGCGKFRREGYTGVDIRPGEGVDVVCDLTGPWPWADDSVDEVISSQLLEHFTMPQRIHFVHELYRVLRKGAKATIVTPHWSSARAYGDPTHVWPPVSEYFYAYLMKSWRDQNVPQYEGDVFTCDFTSTWGYGLGTHLVGRNQEFTQFALQNYKEAASDLVATLVKQ